MNQFRIGPPHEAGFVYWAEIDSATGKEYRLECDTKALTLSWIVGPMNTEANMLEWLPLTWWIITKPEVNGS